MEKEILVKELQYPKTLGQGNEISCYEIHDWYCGCAVIQNLIANHKLMFGYDFTDTERTYQIISSLSAKQKELCSQSPLCGPLINKMINKKYKYNSDIPTNNIQVAYQKGSYIPYEGKHRVCIAKNFLPPDQKISVELLQ